VNPRPTDQGYASANYREESKMSTDMGWRGVDGREIKKETEKGDPQVDAPREHEASVLRL